MGIGETVVAIFAILMISVTSIIIFAPRENIKNVSKKSKK